MGERDIGSLLTKTKRGFSFAWSRGSWKQWEGTGAKVSFEKSPRYAGDGTLGSQLTAVTKW